MVRRLVPCLLLLMGCPDRAGTTRCAEGETACGPRCADLDQDTADCGTCANTCGPGQSCAKGVCSGWVTPPSRDIAPRPAIVCNVPPLSRAEVVALIEKERASRTDLPKAYATSEWKVSRAGCHYWASEHPVPRVLDSWHTFTLNQRGVIVSVIGPFAPIPINCPGTPLTDGELTLRLAEVRAERPDLAPPYPGQTVEVERSGCSYHYVERRAAQRGSGRELIPDQNSLSTWEHGFHFDAFGELLEWP